MTASMFQDLYQRLAGVRASVVPVVGAGLAAECGAPTSNELADGLAAAGGIDRAPDEDLYSLADRLEELHDPVWVQEQVAAAIQAAPITPSLALQALTLLPGRLISTTNYDAAIEIAAERHGLRAITMTPEDLPRILHGPTDDELFVLHLHGTADAPESVVLTSRSYQVAFADEQLGLAMSTLAVGRTLVFLGHSLAATEVHLRRDIRGMVKLFGTGEHLLLHPVDERIADAVQFRLDTGVEPLAFPNEDRSWRFVITAAQALGAPPILRAGTPMGLCTVPIDAAYEPMYAGPAAEVATASNRAVWLYGGLIDHKVTTVSDLADRRLLILGDPGTGKTQALLHLGSQASELPIYLHLGGATAPWATQDAKDIFLLWMERACALRGDIPRVTTDTLRDDTYAFMLDGLDEVRPDSRADLMQVTSDVALEYPQHRWVVASRRVPQLDGALVPFAHYQLVPSREWLLAYAGQRGVSPGEIDQVMAGVPGMNDLLQIPLFAAAAVEVVQRGEKLPESPLDLLLDFASRGLREEGGRLLADPHLVERWLDRLSFAMLVAEVDDATAAAVSVEQLRGTQLDAEITVDWLVTRATLQDAAGRVRPLTRTIRDARAARFLEQHGRGEALLQTHGLLGVDGEVRVRSGWQYVVDLLLAHNASRWAPVIAVVDEVAVARATPTAAPAGEREAALWTIWGWYRRHRIHIPRRRDGQLVDDLDAMVRLAEEGLSLELQAELVESLGSPDPATRGNAITLLSRAAPAEVLEPRLAELLADEDDVVRRRAAEAISHLRLHGYAEALLSRGVADADELARRTLTSVALELAAEDELPSFFERIPRNLRRDIQLGLDRRWTRQEQLEYLASRADPDRYWIEHLIQFFDTPWTKDEVALLAVIWRRDPYASNDRRITSILGGQPAIALRACFEAGVRQDDLFDFIPLFELLEESQLLELAREAGEEAIALVRDYAEWKQQRASGGSEHAGGRVEKESQPLGELLASGDMNALLQVDRSSSVRDLPADQRAAALALVQEEWDALRAAGGALGAIEVTGERQWQGPRRIWHLLHLAAELHLPLNEGEWFELANLGLANMGGWLSATYMDSWMENLGSRVAEASDAGVEAIVHNVGPRFNSSVARALAARALSSDDPELRRTMAYRLADEGHREVLLQAGVATPSQEVDVALVRSGDADAELRCLDVFIERGCPKVDHHGGNRDWIDSVRYEQSADRVFEILTVMLRRGDAPHELSALFHALERCLGPYALDRYDRLMADAEIPGAAFLWYQREEAISRIACELAPVPSVTEAVTEIDWPD